MATSPVTDRGLACIQLLRINLRQAESLRVFIHAVFILLHHQSTATIVVAVNKNVLDHGLADLVRSSVEVA